MESDLRYNLQHVGDAFADLLEAVIDSAKDSAACVADTIQSSQVKRRRGKVIMRIGERAVSMRANDPELFSYDDEMTDVLKDYDSLQNVLDDVLARREARKKRSKVRFSSCEPCRNSEKNEEATAGVAAMPGDAEPAMA